MTDSTTCPAFPMPRTAPFDPPPDYARLRAEDPVSRVELWDGSRVWLISRFEDVRALLSDSRLSASPRTPGYPQLSAGAAAVQAAEESFIRMDSPDHEYFRRMLTKEFTLRRMDALRPAIEGIAGRLVTEMTNRPTPVDLVQAIALPLPSEVISVLLGVPFEDHPFIQERAAARIDYRNTPEVTSQAHTDLLEYLERLVTEKTRHPGDDLLTRLIDEQVRPGCLTDQQLVAMARLLLSAGHETTASMISIGLLTLLQHPEQWDALQADPTLIPGAVEELLRFLTIIPFSTRRAAVEDIEIHGRTIRAGEGIFMLTSSANRDATAFDRPDDFDVHRNPRHHLAFGFGVHQCLGQPLARVELQVMFNVLARRLPGLKLEVDFTSLQFRDEMSTYGVRELPVSW